jgi:hypothetical protein
MGSRTVISSINFPSRIEALSVFNSLNLPSSMDLIYAHTLFPLYAPFLPESRRLNCMQWMKGKSCGAVHLAAGYAASRIPKLRVLRACPTCVKKDILSVGESYWHRDHQITGYSHCPKHGTPLVNLGIYHSMQKRHEYKPIFFSEISLPKPQIFTSSSFCVAEQVKALLNREQTASPSYEQWTAYYQERIDSNGLNKGKYANYPLILEKVNAKWEEQWLRSNRLYPSHQQSCWLHQIIRKHRKSFSYLEHIVAMTAFSGKKVNICDAIDEVSRIDTRVKITIALQSNSEASELERKKLIEWLRLIQNNGVTVARKSSGGALYAWLYKHCQYSLMRINARYRQRTPLVNNRVNWTKRDWSIVRHLIYIRDVTENQLKGPRKSKKWYLSQLDTGTSVDKRLESLPLVNSFLNKYSEDITEYQIRRIARTLADPLHKSLPRWKLLKISGLSDERMTTLTAQFVDSIMLK